MQQQDVAGRQSARQPREDGIGIAVDAVEAPPRPGDVLQAGAMHSVVEQGIAKAHRGAEEDRRGAGRLLDRLARGPELAGEAAGQGQGETQRVRVRVILDAVAPAQDLARQCGFGLDPFADAEEARLGAVSVQDVQDARRDERIGPVVERERNIAPLGAGPGRRLRLGPSSRFRGSMPRTAIAP